MADWGIWREWHVVNEFGKRHSKGEWETVEQEFDDECGGLYKARVTRKFATEAEAQKVADLWNGISQGWIYIPRKIG